MENKFLYRPNWILFLFATLFFGACAAVFIHLALTNEIGAIIDHLIELSVDQATVFYWILAACSVLFILAGLAGLYVSFFTAPVFLEVTNDFIRVPKVLYHKEQLVHFSEVTNAKTYSVSGTHILELHTQTKKIGISNRMLKSNAEFEKIKEFVLAKLNFSQM